MRLPGGGEIHGFNTLNRMKADGYDLEVPPSVEALRARVLEGNAATYGQEANVAAHVDADTIVRTSPYLDEIEEVWGRVQSDGQGVFVLGADFGKVFVGVQPAFGYEGDPMRLLFERGFAPTHAFDPFRMPTEFAIRDGAKQAALPLETHKSLPRSVALVLWSAAVADTDARGGRAALR